MKKRLVLCLDGTWNTPDGPRDRKPTNVAKIKRAIPAAGPDGTPQIVFYDPGVGTDGGRVSRAVAGAVGRGLDQNVKDGYRFLAHNWWPEDEVYIFGFSRGAFTARSLCGFVNACGLLEKSAMECLSDAWDLYRTPKEERPNHPQCAEIKACSRRNVRVTCLGVWDTVGALGVPGEVFQGLNTRHRFHDAELSDLVECGFHALAIDEKRGSFGPTLWQKPKGGKLKQRTVEQVWFPGVHSNVGGSYPDAGLSDLALEWMIDRVRAVSALVFDQAYIDARIKGNPLGEIYEARNVVYTASRALPFQRLIGQKEVEGSFLRNWKWFERRNRPGEKCEFVNEMIHWSAEKRFGQIARENGEVRRYEPENLRAALEGGVPVVDELAQKRPVPPLASPAPGREPELPAAE